LDHAPQKLVSRRVYGSREGPLTSVLCAGAGYAGAERGMQVDGELGGAGRLGKMRGPVGIGRGATYPFPLRGGAVWMFGSGCGFAGWGPPPRPEGGGWKQGLGSRASWGSWVGWLDLMICSSVEASVRGGPLTI
jgi:hypothetical protein